MPKLASQVKTIKSPVDETNSWATIIRGEMQTLTRLASQVKRYSDAGTAVPPQINEAYCNSLETFQLAVSQWKVCIKQFAEGA